jgi:putative component of membrane protein insertase Oxa1/YidC/SpoIIIJ protein YidD
MPRRGPLLRLALAGISFYCDRISSRLPRRCVYEETCSAYALRRLAADGIFRGGLAALRRFRTCNAETAERLLQEAAG